MTTWSSLNGLGALTGCNGALPLGWHGDRGCMVCIVQSIPQYLSPCQAKNASSKLSGKCFPCQSHQPGFPTLLFECGKAWQLPLIAGISLGLMRNCFSQSCQEILAKASAAWRPGKAWGKGHAAANLFRQTLPAPHTARGAGADCLRTSVRVQEGSHRLKHGPWLWGPVASTAAPTRCLVTWVSLVSSLALLLLAPV